MTRRLMFRVAWLAAFGWLAGCDLAPHYVAPVADTPPAYKEADGWLIGSPKDTITPGAWWQAFGDPTLDALEAKVAGANQDLKAAAARYDEARAQARSARADYFPTINAQAGLAPTQLSQAVANPLPQRDYDNYTLGLDLQYEVDVWGRVRNQVKSARAQAAAAAGDLIAVDLSLHAELASDYFILRADDDQSRILTRTVDNYRRDRDLTQARFKVGYAAQPDLAAAEAQYQLARTQATDILLQRAQLEHAIAILIGEAPARFSLPVAPLASTPPAIAFDIPGTLLERRPDVAAAERRVAAANAQIGVARAAYYPAFNLNAILGVEAAQPNRLFSAPATAWSLGPSGLLSLFDGGRRRALNAQAKASYEEAAAQYRQTVLTAYGEVEDSLASVRRLAEEASSQDAGVAAAQSSSDHAGQLFNGGLSSYYDVVTAQNIALAAELSSAKIHGQRMVATVALIRALGGGWQRSDPPPA